MTTKSKPRTVRDMPNRPSKSAIPRNEGSIFLMLNRLSTERERLQQDEADLLARLEQKRQRMVRLEAEIEYYKDRITLFNTPTPAPPAQRPNRVAMPNPISRQIIEMETEEPNQWQELTIEY